MKKPAFKLTLGATLLLTLFGTASAGKLTGGDIKTLAAGSDLARTINNQGSSANQWFTYTVEMQAGNGNPCCFVDFRSKRRSCSLSEENNSWGNSDDEMDSDTLSVYFQWKNGRPDNLFMTGASCPVDGTGKTVISLTDVSERASVDMLTDAIDFDSDHGNGRLVSAVALHEGKYAQQMIEQFSDSDNAKVRHKAIFWLGEARGKPGFDKLLDIVDNAERPLKDRTKAIFAISQSDESAADDKLLQLATTPGNDKIQAKSLFWLANSNHEQTLEVVKQVLDSNSSTKVKQKAIFALTQLESDKGWQTLADLAQNNREFDIQKKAIFWLAQQSKEGGKDATPILMEILQGPAPYSIKKKVVFALSQLPGEKATEALLAVMQSDQSKAIKKKALFWLGQSNDPKALQAIEDILASN